MKAIGRRLREVRGNRTLAEFTEKLGLARTTWSNYEAGRRLPSHEVMELLKRVEGVTPDRILPSSELVRMTSPTHNSDWCGYIPALWLFSRMKGTRKFESEEDELKWWAKRFRSIADELDFRAFELAELRDLYLADAELEVIKDLAQRSPEELWAFIDAS